MTVLRVRVDDRLLHSEVLLGELEARPFEHLVVASDLAWLEAVDASSVPAEVRVTVTRPAEVERYHREAEPTLLVVGTLADLESALISSLDPTEIVLANRARREGTRALSPTYHVDDGEVGLLRALIERGVAVFVQRVPFEEPLPVSLLGLSELHSEGEEPVEPVRGS